jgi:hypothetical protein
MHLSGEMVDTVADYLTIFILFFVPGAPGQATGRAIRFDRDPQRPGG